MKEFFKGLGKGFLYFFIYLTIQSAVSFIYSIIYSIVVFVRYMPTISETTLIFNGLFEQLTIISLLSNIVAVAVIWLVFVIRKKKLCHEIQLTKSSVKTVILTLFLGISFGFVADYIIGLIPFPTLLQDSFEELYAFTSAGSPVVNFIAVGLIGPVVEEIFFRGLIYTRMRKSMNVTAAIIISSLLFGFAHGEIIWILSAFSFGVVLAWIFEKTGSLLPCITIHVVNNILSLILEELPETSEMADIIIIGVCAVIFAVSLVIFLKTTKKVAIAENCIIYEESDEDNE